MLPRVIYELLPWLYSGIGMLAMLGTDPTYGRLSGLLLVTAAAAIFHLRRSYRAAVHVHIDAIQPPTTGSQS